MRGRMTPLRRLLPALLLATVLPLAGCQGGALAGAGETLTATVQGVQASADVALERTDRLLCTAYTERALSAHFGPPGLPRRDLYDAFCAPYRPPLSPPPAVTDSG